MPIIKITKEQIDKAAKAHEAALEKDPEFRAFLKEQERLRKEAEKQQEADNKQEMAAS